MFYFQQSIGIDFREDTLRVVLLGKTFKGMVLIDHLMKRYPALMDKTKESEGLDELVTDLRAFLSEHGRPAEVIVGLPRDKVILREITLPRLDKEELKEIIAYEIDKHIPLPAQELYYDYQIIGDASDTEQRVMLGMIRNEDLSLYLKVLERAELVPTLATPLCFAITDCPGCNHLENQEIALVADGGEDGFELGFMHDKKVLFSRGISLGKGRIDGHMEEVPAGEETGGIDSQTRDMGSGLIYALRQWLRKVKSPSALEKIKIILTGIKTYDSFLADYIHKEYGLDVSIPDPFQGLTEKKIPGRITSAFAMATGLAIKGLKERFTDINLLPPEMRIRRTSHALSFTIVFLILLFLLIALTAYTGIGRDKRFFLPKRMKIERILKASEQLQDQVKEVKLLSQEKERVSKEVDEIEDLMKRRVSKLEALKELSVLIPEDVWLDKVSIDNEAIELNGFADSSSMLIGILEDSPLFENVIFPSTITKRGGEKERFRIKANVQKGLKE